MFYSTGGTACLAGVPRGRGDSPRLQRHCAGSEANLLACSGDMVGVTEVRDCFSDDGPGLILACVAEAETGPDTNWLTCLPRLLRIARACFTAPVALHAFTVWVNQLGNHLGHFHLLGF